VGEDGRVQAAPPPGESDHDEDESHHDEDESHHDEVEYDEVEYDEDASDEARSYARPARRTGRDLVISLVVLLVPIAFIVAVFRLQGGEDPVVIDPSPAMAQAEAAGEFPVSRPEALTEGWRPVSAVYRREDTGAILRVGYLTPNGAGVQLIESNQPTESLLRRELGDSVRPTGAVDISGRPWQSYEVRGGEHALVQTGPDRTMIVIGRSGPEELRALAASLG
jgi:Protein of unknown function (DUF4245)